MEGVRRAHLGSAYMEEPRRSHVDTGEEMEVAAVGVRGRGRWEPRSTSRPAFMVSKAADAAMLEDLKDIKPPMYDGNPLNLDRFSKKLDDWGVTFTEDMDHADAEKYVFRRLQVPPAGSAPRAVLRGDQIGENQDPQGSQEVHFLSVYFFSIDPQKFIDGSTSTPGCSVINESPGLFKFWADPVEPWITIKGPKAAIWSRSKRNNLAVNFICLAPSRNRERRPLPSFATPFSWQCRKLGSRNVPQRTRPKANS